MGPIGYTTDFVGAVTVSPVLNEYEIAYLNDFAASRRMDRTEGPYYANPGSNYGQDRTAGVRDDNSPPPGQPGLWCQWVPADFGREITWDEGEKFYESAEWMSYLIEHFLKLGAVASQDLPASIAQDPRFAHFTFDHVLNGQIEAQGEDPDDRWLLVVENNVVKVAKGTVSYEAPEPI